MPKSKHQKFKRKLLVAFWSLAVDLATITIALKTVWGALQHVIAGLTC